MTHNALTSRIVRAWSRRDRHNVSRTLLFAGCAIASIVGCRGDSATAVNADGAHVFWSLANSPGAAALAVGGTLQIVATPLYPTGDSIPGLPTASFTSLDPSRVTVSSTGLVTGVAVTNNPVAVVSTLTSNGITNTDTTMVAVTATRSPVASILIQPAFAGTLSGDTLNEAYQAFDFVFTTVLDSMGNPVSGVAVKVTVLDPSIANLFDGELIAQAVGSTKIVASTNAYGISVADTVILVIGNPMSASFNICPTCSQLSLPTLSPKVAVIGAGGTVMWSGAQTTLIFNNNASDIPGGSGTLNVPAPPNSLTLTFPTPGKYHFTLGTGDTATVAVVPNN